MKDVTRNVNRSGQHSSRMLMQNASRNSRERRTMPDTKEILATNIQFLMALKGLTYYDLDKLSKEGRSDISGRLLRLVVRGESSPTVERLIALSKLLKVSPWMLLWPDLPDNLVDADEVAEIIKHYASSTKEGREYIARTAEFTPKKI